MNRIFTKPFYKAHRAGLLSLMVCLLLSACASNEIYHSQYHACAVTATQDCRHHAIQHFSDKEGRAYQLGFVEIDDQGQLRDRAQLNLLLNDLTAASAHNSLLINVFVHGWHHSAEPGDSNIASFKQSLAELSAVEQQRHPHNARRIVGIYVGWRGESIDFPLLNNFTFWDRKNTAQEVGQLGMAELLLKLEQIRDVKNTQSPEFNSRLVVIGHSFGGAAVFRATAQILADRFVDSHRDKNVDDTAKGFGDLVVLLNPAIEALNYAPLYDLAQARCHYFNHQTPKLIVLTSESDYATKLAFPAGRIFSTFFESHGDVVRNDCSRPVSYHEGQADRTTIGHFEPFITHELNAVTATQNPDYQRLAALWSQHDASTPLSFGDSELVSLNKTAALNPYLNVRVDKKLIGNHNDVFGVEIMNFIRQMILLSSAD